MNRRAFLKLCGLTAGGGMLGVGKAVVAEPASTLAVDMLTLSMSTDEAVDATVGAMEGYDDILGWLYPYMVGWGKALGAWEASNDH